jgi:hypothetical protein
MKDTVHIPYVVDRLDEIIELYEDDDDSLSAVEELRRELIFNMGVNALARHKGQDADEIANPVIKLRGVPDD